MAGRSIQIRPGSAYSKIKNPTDGVPIEEMSLESNSFASQAKEESPSEPIPLKKEKMKVKIRKKKKSIFSSFSETFFGEDGQQVMDYIIHDVLIPAAKSTVLDMISGGVEMLFYGDRSEGSRIERNRGRSSIVSYANYYNRDREKPSYSRRERGRRVGELIFERRTEAEKVLEDMYDILEEYGQVSVADLYDLIKVTSNDFTNQNFGWVNLKNAHVSRVRDGYLLNLPKTVTLE